MAIFSFSDLAGSYPQLYRELRPQIQRKAPIARVLEWKPVTTGQNIGWDVTFAGQAASAVNPDGGNLLTAVADPQAAATLGYGAYSAPIRVTTKAQWTGAAQNSASFLQNLIERNTNEALNALVKLLNQDIYAGAGGNAMTGMSTAIAGSGTYANVNPATSGQGNWVSYSAGNSGSLRSLTLAMIKTMNSTIATNSPVGRPDYASCTPAVFNTLEGLFDANFRLNIGVNETMKMGVLKTAGGEIKQATGFRTLYWENQDITFIEDPDCKNTAVTNTANAIYAWNSASMEMNFLPPVGVANYMPDQKIMAAVEQDLGPLANLQLDFRARGRTNFSDEFDLLGMVQLVVKDRAATGLLFDVQ